MKRVICLLIVGDKHQNIYSEYKEQFELYAKKCNADLKIIDYIPDPSFKMPLFAQKLLIPRLLTEYDLALFMDIDILINKNAPCIFDGFPDDKTFGAVIDPRGTKEFNTAWGHDERIINETVESYFVSRAFEYHPNLIGSINGGVLLFRPAAVKDMFAEYYYSAHQQGAWDSFEESSMAYLTQIDNKFQPLDPRFNAQVFYRLKGTAEGLEIFRKEQKIPGWLRKRYYQRTGNIFYPTGKYKKLIRRELEKNYFLHFAGSFPLSNKWS